MDFLDFLKEILDVDETETYDYKINNLFIGIQDMTPPEIDELIRYNQIAMKFGVKNVAFSIHLRDNLAVFNNETMKILLNYHLPARLRLQSFIHELVHACDSTINQGQPIEKDDIIRAKSEYKAECVTRDLMGSEYLDFGNIATYEIIMKLNYEMPETCDLEIQEYSSRILDELEGDINKSEIVKMNREEVIHLLEEEKRK